MSQLCILPSLVAVIVLITRRDTLTVAIDSDHTKTPTVTWADNLLSDSVHDSVNIADGDDDSDDSHFDGVIDAAGATSSLDGSEERAFLGLSEVKVYINREIINGVPRLKAVIDKNADNIADSVWKYIDDVKLALGMLVFTKLTEADAFRCSAKGQLFDEFMGKQVKSCLKNRNTYEFVKKELRMEKLSGEALRSHPNIKYYDELLT